MLQERAPRSSSRTFEVEPPVRGPLPRFGVALFDESKDSGWACLPDSAPFRFRSPQELRNDSIWICSSDGPDHSRRWGKTHHLRPSDYFSKLTYIAADYGLRVDGEGKWGVLAQKASAILAPTVHRAMVVAAQVYDWREPSQMMQSDSLTDDIRKWLVEPPEIRNYMRGPLAGAFQTYSSCNWAGVMGSSNSVTMVLRFNRLKYARRIMATEVPDGAWSYIEVDSGKSGTGYSLEQALDPEVPCLVNATVEFGGRDPDIATLSAYGSQPGRRTALRAWISQPELRWLSQHARIHISAVRYAACAKPLPAKLMLPELLTSDALFELSIPVGLVAEAHWKAIAKDVYKPSLETKKEISPWAVWLRAADRAFCFELALAAHKSKFHVVGYGNGSVVVRCDRERLTELLDFSMENDIAHPSFRTVFEEHGLLAKD